MKKIVSLLLCISLTLSLAGCSGNEAPETPSASGDTVTLTMWVHQNEPWVAAYEDAIAAFEAENEGIKIDLETFPYFEFEAKVQTSLIDGEGGADIYELWGGWALDFIPYGTLMALPDDFAAQIQEETYAPTYGVLMNDGKMYGVPLEFNIEYGGMLVNIPLMEASGISAPGTWEELREAAVQGTVREGDTLQVKGFDFVSWDIVSFYFLSMILQQGADYMTEDGRFDVTTEEAKTAFAELASMVTEDHVTDLEDLSGGGDMEGYQRLFAGRETMCPHGSWTISEGIESFGLEYGKDFDYVSVPPYGDNQTYVAETGWSLAVNSSCAQQEAAMKFIQYLYQDDVMLEHNIRCTQIPAKISLAESDEYLEAMPYAKVQLDILEDAQFIGYFNTDRLKEAVNNTFEEYCSGNYASVDEAMEVLNTRLNEILK